MSIATWIAGTVGITQPGLLPCWPRLVVVQGGSLSSADSRLDVSAWARVALATVNELPGVHRAGLALPEGGGRRLRFTASERTNQERVEWCYIDAYDDVPLTTAVRTGAPVCGALDQLAARYADFVERQLGTTTVAVAAIPLVAASRTIGAFVLFFDQRQEFDALQRLELTRLGEDLGGELRRAQRTGAYPPTDTSDERTSPGATFAVHDVAADPVAVSAARKFLRRTLDGWGIDDETTDTAVLCLSELVTNALIHARTGCAVRAVLEESALTVTVRDGGSPGAASTVPLDDPLRVHGRGLHLVDSLVTRWGSRRDSVGTTVWFVLEPVRPAPADH